MATPAYEQLYVVQQLDIQLNQLAHKHAHHPVRGSIAEVDADLVVSQAALDEIGERQHELERSRKRLDDEVSSVSIKRADIKAKLYDGSVTASKDLLAMQEEEKHLADRQRALEDEELEFMEQLETAAAERAAIDVERAPLLDKRASLEADLTVALAETEAETEKAQADRDAAAATIPPDMMARYEQRKKDLGGVAIARVVGSACGGCHLSLAAVAIDHIKKVPDDEIVTCEECGRMLIH